MPARAKCRRSTSKSNSALSASRKGSSFSGGTSLGGDLLDSPAPFADKVLVVVVGQVEDCRPVGKVGVVDDPELLEGVEGAVDGRDIDRWEPAVDLRGDVLGRDVRLGREEGLEDCLAGRRPAHPVGGELVQDCRHTGIG